MKNKNLLKMTLITVIIAALTIISFGGIYVSYKNTMKNIIPEYLLGKDLKGYRQIRLEAKVESVDNEEEKLSDYQKSKEILGKRLDKFGVTDYNIRLNKNDGTISVELPENDYTDEAIYELMYQGKFEVLDSNTNEVLMTNDDLQRVLAGYGTNNSGYTSVYISFEFNKEGTEKLKNITNTYIKTTVSTSENSENEEGQEDAENKTEEMTKQILIKVDDEELIETYFEQEITNGIMQLSFGSNSNLTVDEMQERLESARNLAVLLDGGKLPIEYQVTGNTYIESDINQNQISIIIYVITLITAIGLVYLMVRYKNIGVKAAISIIGYIGVLLIALRIFNVEINISGIFATILSIILDFALIMNILKENKKENNMSKSVSNTLKKYAIILAPSIIIAIVFTMIGISFGTVLFWGIFINLLYNLSLTKVLFVDKK